MKYLLYLRDGLVKKFPLKKKTVYLGRDPQCDLCIDEEFITWKHAKITCFDDEIKVADLDSKNGVYVENLRTKEAQVSLGESFRIGHLEFFLKFGNPKEFVLSEKTRPLVKKISNLMVTSREDTKTCLNLFDKTLLLTLRLGFTIDHFEEILQWAKISLANTLKTGGLMILCRENNKDRVLSNLNLDEDKEFVLNRVDLDRDIFEKEILNRAMGQELCFYSFPILLGNNRGTLLYTRKRGKRLDKKFIAFLKDFSSELALIYRLIEQNKSGFRDKDDDGSLLEIVTRDENMLNLLGKCKKIAVSDLFVLVEGETGTGKELLARFIHRESRRKKDSYIAINCSAIPETLLEDELFGHEKGAFSGAGSSRTGKLELASGGTLVLDEIGEMSLDLQVKLLRVLQESEFYRLGGNKKINVDLKVISITNKDLHKLVGEKRFREDLYYRITHFKIKIPPLRERPDDIQPLINYFFEKFSLESRIYVSGFSHRAVDALQSYHWPGNVRELENEIKSLINQSNNRDIIDFDLLNSDIKSHYLDLKGDTLQDTNREREQLVALLEENRWNKSEAAKKLDISRTALYKRMKKFKIG